MKISITSHSSSSFFFALFFFCWRFYYTLNHWIAFVVIYLVMIIRVCRSWQNTHPKSFEKTHFYLCVYLSEGVCLLWKERRNINLCHVREMKARWLCAVLGGCNFFTCIIEGEEIEGKERTWNFFSSSFADQIFFLFQIFSSCLHIRITRHCAKGIFKKESVIS